MTAIELTEPAPVARDKVTLKTVDKPIDASTPRIGDVVQGQIGNCPIAAVMVAMAHAAPSRVKAMVGSEIKAEVLSKPKDEDKFTHTSTFYYEIKFTGNSTKVQISPCLYYSGEDLQYASSPGGPGWPSYVEKAYAVWRGKNSYSRLQDISSLTKPPSANEVMKDLVGRFDYVDFDNNHFYPDKGGDQTLTVKTLIGLLGKANKRVTIAASRPENTSRFKIIENHAYAVLRIDKQSAIHLRNPHGGTGADVQIKLSDFRGAFLAMLQGAG